MPHLVSLNVGLPRDVAWQGRTVHTGIWKEPVWGRRVARRLNIDGDGQGDLAGHGGERRAVLVYQVASYRYWEGELGRGPMSPGQFGENFTVDGLADDEVCIGDRYRIGSALFEVTQPRVPCFRLGIRMDEPKMAAFLVSHDRPGFYMRVIEEGEVGAGDRILRVVEGPEGMTVVEVNALLYKPGHSADQLERALRIPALSEDWRDSFEALLEQARQPGATGNAGLVRTAGVPPAWAGFRPLRVASKSRETGDVTSLELEAQDGSPLSAGLPGQFVVLRLRPAPGSPLLLRSYSLSGEPSDVRYRISVKREARSIAGAYIADEARPGDIIETTAPRGVFVLEPGDRPVVLLSAGIGATPVLAMLHALAAAMSPRQVWWLHGARNRAEHAFAAEVRALLGRLPCARSHILYSMPGPGDRPGVDFDEAGRFSITVLAELGVPHDAEFYLCGPAAFMVGLSAGLSGWGVPGDRIRTEAFGPGTSRTPGIAASPRPPPHPPAGIVGAGFQVSFARSGLNVRWDAHFASLLELAEACDVPVRWSCRTGVCHNCETALIAGDVRYQLDPVDRPAEGNALICCCQPDGDLVLDL
jgi:ferredoxin-NADP reductase/MOSC domain-containing protein YiiM